MGYNYSKESLQLDDEFPLQMQKHGGNKTVSPRKIKKKSG